MDNGNEINQFSKAQEILNKYDGISKEWRHFGTGAYYSEYEQTRFEDALISESPKILKELEKGQLFARWSPDIELDKTPGKVSKTVSNRGTRAKPMDETGISVYVIDPKKPNFGLDRRYDMTGVHGYRPRKLHIIRGNPVDIGHDSEWLLEPTSIQEVLTIPYECKILEDFPELKYYNPYN